MRKARNTAQGSSVVAWNPIAPGGPIHAADSATQVWGELGRFSVYIYIQVSLSTGEGWSKCKVVKTEKGMLKEKKVYKIIEEYAKRSEMN